VADVVQWFGGLVEAGAIQQAGRLLQEGCVDEAEAAATGADFFLHADDLADEHLGLRRVILAGQAFDGLGQAADAARPDDGQRRVKHDSGRFLDGFGKDDRPVGCGWFAGGVVEQAFRGKHALGEAGFLQGFGRANHRGFEDRVGQAVFAAGRVTGEGQTIVGLEMKPQVFRHAGQPEYRGLHADNLAGRQQFVEPPGAGFRVAEGFEAHLQAERLLQAFDDGLGRHAVGHQRQAVDLDDGNVGKRQRRR